MGRELKRVPMNFVSNGEEGEEPPVGAGYQMWQTVSDQPYTPVFATAEELALFCASNPWGAEVSNPVPYGTWLCFINGPGWAPSMAMTNGAFVSGVEMMAAAWPPATASGKRR